MRDKGRWAKGTSGNPGGRPKSDRGIRYWEITRSACTFKSWRAIVKKAVEQAEKGDRYARAWLADRLLGKDLIRMDVQATVDREFAEALEQVYPDDNESDESD